ncbi:MAG TPA: hypothetical protein VLN72_03715 [Gillisia sp.]|nr:hypothetical protein [Gillisia sp.]
MNHLLHFAVILLLLTGCNSNQNQTPEKQIVHLEGYWEIKRVEIAPDSIREYNYNETVDFFDLNGKEGIRKKVRPQLDGTFQVTEDSENIKVVIEDRELFIYYTTPYDTWKERVVHAEENELKLENEDGMIYHYTRYSPINIDSEKTYEKK